MLAPMIMGMAVLTGAPAETRPTMMAVEVELDWTRTVTSTPIIKPTMGFLRRSELEKSEPMFFPPSILKLSLSEERDHLDHSQQDLLHRADVDHVLDLQRSHDGVKIRLDKLLCLVETEIV